MTTTAVRFPGDSAARTMLPAVAGTLTVRPTRAGTILTPWLETAKVAFRGALFSAFCSLAMNSSAFFPPREIERDRVGSGAWKPEHRGELPARQSVVVRADQQRHRRRHGRAHLGERPVHHREGHLRIARG